MTAKQLRSNYSGIVADIIGETDDYYWVQHKTRTAPFTVPKIDRSWSAYTPTPQVGDIWSSTSDDYRVIGVDEKRNQYFVVPARNWFDGEWPELPLGRVQHGETPDPQVFVRVLPEEYLAFASRLP